MYGENSLLLLYIKILYNHMIIKKCDVDHIIVWFYVIEVIGMDFSK